MSWFLQYFKRKANSAKSNLGLRPSDDNEFMKQFYLGMNHHRKKVLAANIVGMTLTAAREILPQIIICPYEMDDVVIGHEEAYMSNRVNVAVHGDVITRIINFG